MRKIMECVPNLSEGRDKKKINEIVSVVERKDVKLLDVSSDENHNRSVITFAGEPLKVKEAAFDLIKKAAESIDMSQHQGEHPRMGAIDVCPFVPLGNMTMNECVHLAWELGKEVGDFGLSGYFYEAAAKRPERENLADIRKGEYESLPEKLKLKEWEPDFGPAVFNPKFGAVVIGAREFLIAFNINLKSDNLDFAKNISRIIRHSGGMSEIKEGEKIRIPGVFKTVKAIGVDTRDKGYVQVSMNLTDYKIDPIYVVFETIKRIAELCDVEILSSELIGLAPGAALKDVPAEYLKLKGFDKKKQIIEEVLGEL